MTILHISNGFLGLSKVHRVLFQAMDQLGLRQSIFAVTRKSKARRAETELQFQEGSSKIIYSRCLKLHHKFLYKRKAKYLYQDLIRQVHINDIAIAHATTLFSDGILALKLYKDYGTRYIVTVRNTDLNLFLKFRKDLYNTMNEILKNASKIIFLTEAYRESFFTHPSVSANQYFYRQKSVVLNNGIDKFWLKNITPKRQVMPFRLLYVGRLSKEKNLNRLIHAVVQLRERYPKIQLTIVGAAGNDKKNVLSLIGLNADFIHYKGEVHDKAMLLDIYRGHDIFAMPSLRETFGLVYIEALSQGLPVLFTADQGIDGVFGSLKIGEKVNAHSVSSIAQGLEKVLLNFGEYDLSRINFTRFDWDKIAEQYRDMYYEIEKQ